MKIKLFILAFFVGMTSLSAQLYDPVDWTFSQEKMDGNQVKLIMTASIEEGWHVYSLDIPEESFILPTEVSFKSTPRYKLIGSVVEPTPIEEYDKNAEEVLKFHEHKVSLYQIIERNSADTFSVRGELSFMVCNDEMCLPPEYIDLNYSIKAAELEASSDSDESNDKSMIGIFILSILGGFAALLTPCVFPMVPMTVSFFTKQSKTKAAGIRNALIYSLSIIGVYLFLSLPFHIFDSISPDILNEVSTNVPLNIFFFIIFVVFAISFFGAFELTLPNSLINKADKASDIGGLIGIFFMAITLVLVSFSCTGPLLGALLGSVLSSDGGASALSVGMAGFGVGLALPFGVFAAFPSWLNSLPKSGGWLNTVKVVLGFLELALAFKFLSNADLVLQAGILNREIFLAIWISILLALALYLFGAFKLPHDSKLEFIGVGRMLLGVTVLAFTIYLIPGLWGAPLKVISGFPPPSFYSESPNGFGSATIIQGSGGSMEIPDGADPEHCPLSLNCFHDYDEGLAYAKEINKPILLDFTGWACVNCRKMEEQVWSDPRVLNILREEVVLVSLYVDERQKLAEEERYVSEATGKSIKTVGNKWSDFQITNFQNNSQPYYVIVGHDNLEPLIETAAYDPDIDLYIDWLKRGVENFKNK